jgi:hypothetical protein
MYANTYNQPQSNSLHFTWITLWLKYLNLRFHQLRSNQWVTKVKWGHLGHTILNAPTVGCPSSQVGHDRIRRLHWVLNYSDACARSRGWGNTVGLLYFINKDSEYNNWAELLFSRDAEGNSKQYIEPLLIDVEICRKQDVFPHCQVTSAIFTQHFVIQFPKWHDQSLVSSNALYIRVLNLGLRLIYYFTKEAVPSNIQGELMAATYLCPPRVPLSPFQAHIKSL